MSQQDFIDYIDNTVLNQETDQDQAALRDVLQEIGQEESQNA